DAGASCQFCSRARQTSMIILQIKMFDFMDDDLKRDPPVSTDGNAPCSGTVSGKLVNAPAGRALHLVQDSRQDQHSDNFAYPRDKIRTEPPAVIILDKTP